MVFGSQSDKEREQRRRMLEQQQQQQYSNRGPPPPPPPPPSIDAHSRMEIEMLKEKLQEALSKALAAETQIEVLRKKLAELESAGALEKESSLGKIKKLNERLCECEETMQNAQLEVAKYQSMLTESQVRKYLISVVKNW